VLRFTSCQAEIAGTFCRALAAFIGEKLGIPSEFIDDIPWQERERLLDRGDIHVSWICGLPYVRKNNGETETVKLLAAPVMRHPRYGGKPIYYSDVVVHADSSLRRFEDLRGKEWAYNEPGSHSGYNLIRYYLAVRGFSAGYFGRVVESGSHQSSLRMILAHEIDAAALDSTVLEMEFRKNPSLVEQVRTITTLGPSPAPPWVVHGSVSDALLRALRREFMSMDTDPRGRQILEDAGMLRFTRVLDHEYHPIREMEQIASTVKWS
jgi:phosphonate transport system substrate-binding protein